MLHAHRLARQGAGHEHGLAGMRMAFGPARHAATVVAEVDDRNGLRGLVEGGPQERGRRMAVYYRRCRRAPTARDSEPPGAVPTGLFLLPGAAGLVPPARLGAGHPPPREHLADQALPTPDGRWSPRSRGTPPCGRGCRGDRGVHHPVLPTPACRHRALKTMPSAVKQRACRSRRAGWVEAAFHARLDRLIAGVFDGDVWRRLPARCRCRPASTIEIKRRCSIAIPPPPAGILLDLDLVGLVDHL